MAQGGWKKAEKQLVFKYLRTKDLVPSCSSLCSLLKWEALDSYKIIYKSKAVLNHWGSSSPELTPRTCQDDRNAVPKRPSGIATN